ncbi:MAG: dihydrodipicolinate synthase family protein [Eubacteriales bacterium]
MKQYQGIIPAFYAAYDKDGNINTQAIKDLAQYYVESGVTGVYVGGSSGECIYQSVEDRKQTLEAVMEVAKGKLTVISHVACNNTKDSVALAAHSETLGVEAIAAIPPIYFKLPPTSVMAYWNEISAAAPNTDFFIYNIPVLAGTTLTVDMYREMLQNPRVKGVKNSSSPVQDIQEFCAVGGSDKIVFNGPDEQLASGLVAGARGGIGGTYGACPELYLAIYNAVMAKDIAKAQALQATALDLIHVLCSGKGHMYAIIKEVMKRRIGIDCGGVRSPLANLVPEDESVVNEALTLIKATLATL